MIVYECLLKAGSFVEIMLSFFDSFHLRFQE